jgi:hypothetical protein
MMRYFFDIREGDNFGPDNEGIELPLLETAQVEAARSLAKSCPQQRSQPTLFAGGYTGPG